MDFILLDAQLIGTFLCKYRINSQHSVEVITEFETHSRC